MKKLFWKLSYAGPSWNRGKLFEWHWVPDQISGILYAGVTLFGWSILYTDY